MAMNNPLDRIEDSFELEIPARESMDDYLDTILPQIRQFSEDLREQKFYSMSGGKPWLEIRDDPGFQEAVLHFFNEGSEYLQSVDGNVSRGRWRLLDGTNKIIIEQSGGGGGDKEPARSELFELAFLNQQFFVLKKHGDQQRKGRKKYLVLAFEPVVKGLKWKDVIELMYNEFRSQWGTFQYLLVAAVILAIIVVLFSVL
jgi:hypothetical protein